MRKPRKPDEVERKPDLSEGKSDISEIIKKRKDAEKNLVSFRINASTVILVDPKKANEEYRKKSIQKLKLANTKKL